MALSKRDQEFYEEKLSVKSAGYLFLYTMLVGAIAMPSLIYLLDAQSGSTRTWSFHVVFTLAEEGLMLGCVVAVIMYLAFKALLQMGWLPSRPR
jgi:dipeptide/tripeptide permease